MKELLNYETKSPSKLGRLFYWASGADPQILRQSSYSDQVKLFCLGGIVLATGAMAALAGGYAFYTIFRDPKQMVEVGRSADWDMILPSVLFGMVWGYIILNLDRYIVTSTGKGDGTDRITQREILNALPRIIMGTVIALTISKPLEIRIFKSEIDGELRIKQEEYIHTLNQKFAEQQQYERNRLERERQLLRNNIQHEIQNRDNLQLQYIAEVRIIKDGPRAKAIKKDLEKIETGIKELEQKDADLKAQEDELSTVRNQREKIHRDQARSLDGLLERIKISHEIGGWISIFIALLFWVLEITPIFFKLMIIKSPYDYMQENVDKIMLARQAIEFRPEYFKLKDGETVDTTIFYVPNQLIEEQKQITDKQKELSEQIVNLWAEKEKAHIGQNVEEYIVRGAPIGNKPDAEAPSPDAEAPSPDAEAPSPDAEAPTPDAEAPTPDAETPTPDTEAPTSKEEAPDVEMPEPEAVAPEPEVVAPDAEAPIPDAEAPSPDAEAPATDAPNTDAETPAPDAVSPDEEAHEAPAPKEVSNDGEDTARASFDDETAPKYDAEGEPPVFKENATPDEPRNNS